MIHDRLKISINKLIFLFKNESPSTIKISAIRIVPRFMKKGDTIYEYDLEIDFTFECDPFMLNQFTTLGKITEQLQKLFSQYGLSEKGELITQNPSIAFFEPTILQLGAVTRDSMTTKCSLVYNIFHD